MSYRKSRHDRECPVCRGAGWVGPHYSDTEPLYQRKGLLAVVAGRIGKRCPTCRGTGKV